jgi:hypothetical protein
MTAACDDGSTISPQSAFSTDRRIPTSRMSADGVRAGGPVVERRDRKRTFGPRQRPVAGDLDWHGVHDQDVAFFILRTTEGVSIKRRYNLRQNARLTFQTRTSPRRLHTNGMRRPGPGSGYGGDGKTLSVGGTAQTAAECSGKGGSPS